MVGESVHPLSNSMATETDKHKHLDHEIRDMIAALTKRLAELHHIHKSNGSGSSQGHAHTDSSHHHHRLGQHNDDQNQNGLHIIALTGSNQGATMHGELLVDKTAEYEDADNYDALGTTYVNSNFQAVNNSVVMGGSYTTNDPGVHLDISDFIDHEHDQKHNAGDVRKKEKDKEHGKSKQHESDDRSD